MSSDHEEYTLEELEEAKLTAYALGELDELERADVEALLLRSETARRFVQETSLWADRVREAYRQSPTPEPSATLREAVEKELRETTKSQPGSRTMSASENRKPSRRKLFLGLGVAGIAVVVLLALSLPSLSIREAARHSPTKDSAKTSESAAATREFPAACCPPDRKEESVTAPLPEEKPAEAKLGKDGKDALKMDEFNRRLKERGGDDIPLTDPVLRDLSVNLVDESWPTNSNKPYEMPDAKTWEKLTRERSDRLAKVEASHRAGLAAQERNSQARDMQKSPQESEQVPVQNSPTRRIKSSQLFDPPANVKNGLPKIEYQAATENEEKAREPLLRGAGVASNRRSVDTKGNSTHPVADLVLPESAPADSGTLGLLPKVELPQNVPPPPGTPGERPVDKESYYTVIKPRWDADHDGKPDDQELIAYPDAEYWRKVAKKSPNAEQYDPIQENDFLPVTKEPLSTFSIDVDTASYANVRRFLREGRLPPPSAVRIEELVNYFSYNYAPPTDGTPFAVNMETAACPWKSEHRLLRVALKGREIDRKNRGACNIVFLLDVSGSMDEADKLPLVKEAMKMLVEQLTEDDRVAIVTYASETRVVLPSARGNERERIKGTIDALHAGGSTYGSGGIQLAYQQAAEHFVTGGVNRVILCTDGDLNVGVTRDEDLVEMIQEKAKSGVFLTVLGFGTGNLKNSKMQKLADKGNGIYAYVDCLREARKILVEQMTGSLVTIAKDVKIQIEFNPAVVQAYRLIGYEKRKLANQDFNDDKKDAGEIGAGHAVTALYELVPAGTRDPSADVEGGLKYQRPVEEKTPAPTGSDELLTLKIRYKEPEKSESKLLEFAAKDTGKKFAEATPDFRFAASVAAFGMTLRSSPYRGNVNFAAVAEFAAGTTENDSNGYRTEYLDLVRTAEKLARGTGE